MDRSNRDSSDFPYGAETNLGFCASDPHLTCVPGDLDPNVCPGGVDDCWEDMFAARHSCSFPTDETQANTQCGLGLTGTDATICSDADTCGSGADAGTCAPNDHSNITRCGTANGLACQGTACAAESAGDVHCVSRDYCSGGGVCLDGGNNSVDMDEDANTVDQVGQEFWPANAKCDDGDDGTFDDKCDGAGACNATAYTCDNDIADTPSGTEGRRGQIGTDLTGWQLIGTKSNPSVTQTFSFPAGTSVQPGGVIVIGRNAEAGPFADHWGALPQGTLYFKGNNSMPVINGTYSYTLVDGSGNTVDGTTVVSSSAGSLHRNNTEAGNLAHWTSTPQSGATPGVTPSTIGFADGAVFISEMSDAVGSGNYNYEFIEITFLAANAGICDPGRTLADDILIDASGNYHGCYYIPNCYSNGTADNNRTGGNFKYDTATWADEKQGASGTYPSIASDTSFLKTCSYQPDAGLVYTNCGDGLTEATTGLATTDRVCSNQDTCGGTGNPGYCMERHHATTTKCGIAAGGRPWGTEPGTCQDVTLDGAAHALADNSTVPATTTAYRGDNANVGTCPAQSDGDYQCIPQDLCDGTGACVDNGYSDAGTACGSADEVCSDQDTCGGLFSDGTADVFGEYESDHQTNPKRYTGIKGIASNQGTTEGLCMRRHHIVDTLCGNHPGDQDQIRGAESCQALPTSWNLTDGSTKASSAAYRGDALVSLECGAQDDGATDCIKQDKCDGSGVCEDALFEDQYTACGPGGDEVCSDQDSCGGAATDVTGAYNATLGQFVQTSLTNDNSPTRTDLGLCLNRHHAPGTVCGRDAHDASDAPNVDSCQIPGDFTRADTTTVTGATTCRGGATACPDNTCKAQTHALDDEWEDWTTSCVIQDTCGGGTDTGQCQDGGFKGPEFACHDPHEVCSREDRCGSLTAEESAVGPDKCLPRHDADTVQCYKGTNTQGWSILTATVPAACACKVDATNYAAWCTTGGCQSWCDTNCVTLTGTTGEEAPPVYPALDSTIAGTSTPNSCQEYEFVAGEESEDADPNVVDYGTNNTAVNDCLDKVTTDAAYPDCVNQDLCTGGGACGETTNHKAATAACDPRKNPVSRGFFGEVCVLNGDGNCNAGDCTVSQAKRIVCDATHPDYPNDCYDTKGFCVRDTDTGYAAANPAAGVLGTCTFFPKATGTLCDIDMNATTPNAITLCSLQDTCEPDPTDPTGDMYCDPRNQPITTSCNNNGLTGNAAIDCWESDGACYGTGCSGNSCPDQQVCEKQDVCGDPGSGLAPPTTAGTCPNLGVIAAGPDTTGQDPDPTLCHAGKTGLHVTCDPPRYCDGENPTCPAPVHSDTDIQTFTCRTACEPVAEGQNPPAHCLNETTGEYVTGPCDIAETCAVAQDGDRSCPADTWKANTVACGGVPDECQKQDLCHGANASCEEQGDSPDGPKDSNGKFVLPNMVGGVPTAYCTVTPLDGCPNSYNSCVGGACNAQTVRTCAADYPNVQCGDKSDGCGGTINCGTCSTGRTCSAAGKCELDCWVNDCCSASTGGACGDFISGNSGCYECLLSNFLPPSCSQTGAWGGICATSTQEFCGADCGCTVTDGDECTNTGGTAGTCVGNSCCIPDCSGKVCGSDGCGGTCSPNACDASSGLACNSAGQCACNAATCTATAADNGYNSGNMGCLFGSCLCMPAVICPLNYCGTISNGCGGTLSCGGCAEGLLCVDNTCQDVTDEDCCQVHSNSTSTKCSGTINTTNGVDAWVPDTNGNCLACVLEMEEAVTCPLGGNCQLTCDDPNVSTWSQECVDYAFSGISMGSTLCNPMTSTYCDDGCIQECSCQECQPSCGTNTCGDDGCGGSCGTCTGGQVCESGACVASDCCSANGTPGCSDNACEDCVAAYQLQECMLDYQGATIQCTINGNTSTCVPNGFDGNETCVGSCDEENTSGTWNADCVTYSNTTSAPFTGCTFGGTDYGCADGCKDECACAGNCDSKNCGDDGVGGTCGTCVDDFETCLNGSWCNMLADSCCNNEGETCSNQACLTCMDALATEKCYDEGNGDDECSAIESDCETWIGYCTTLATDGYTGNDGIYENCAGECGCGASASCVPKTAEYYTTGLGVTCFNLAPNFYPDGCGGFLTGLTNVCGGEACANTANDDQDGDGVAGQCVTGGGLHNEPTIRDSSCGAIPFRSFNTSPNTGPGVSALADNACPASSTPANYCCPVNNTSCTSPTNCTFLDENGNQCIDGSNSCTPTNGCGGVENQTTGDWIEDCELCVCFGQGGGAWGGEPSCCNQSWSEACSYFAKNNCASQCQCTD